MTREPNESTELTENDILNDGATVTPSQANNGERITSALTRLPVELWDHILCLSSDMPIDFGQGFVSVAPFVFRYVCQLWKNIVDGNPSFWTSVNLTCDAENTTAGLQEAFDIVLRNSAMRPLSMYVKRKEIAFYANATPVFPLMQKASHQTEFLQIYGPHAALKMAAACWRTSKSSVNIPLKKLDLEIELVKEVRLELDDVMNIFVGGYPQGTMQDLTITVSSMNINQLREQGCEVFWTAASRLNWRALTTLKLATEEADSESTNGWNPKLRFCFTANLLRLAHKLQHFRIEGDMTIFESYRSVTLRSLRTLYIHGVVHGGAIFELLVCPALEELHIGGCGSHASMLDFVARCTSTLTCLSIDLSIGTSSVQSLLVYRSIGFLAHRVTTLTLSVSWTVLTTMDMSFHFLSLSPSSFPALQNLNLAIVIRGGSIVPFPWHQMDKFLPETVARLLPGSEAPLKNFKLVFDMSYDRVFQEEHDVWWEGGMRSAVIQQLRTMKHSGQLKQNVSVYALTGYYGEQILNLI